jgi:hypothetical protein
MINIYASMMRIATRLESATTEAPSFNMTECRNRIKVYVEGCKAD